MVRCAVRRMRCDVVEGRREVGSRWEGGLSLLRASRWESVRVGASQCEVGARSVRGGARWGRSVLAQFESVRIGADRCDSVRAGGGWYEMVRGGFER